MMEEKIRKTDRRSRYTCRVIKETLLALLKERPFTKINVSQLCRAADLTRGTFYLHYRDLYDVLDDVLEEALHLTEGDFTENEFWQLLELGEHDAAALPERLLQQYSLLPVCQRVTDIPAYRVLFLDETIALYVLQFIFRREKSRSLPFLENYLHVDEAMAERIFLFFVAGAFAVNQHGKWQKDPAWYEFQSLILQMFSRIPKGNE